MYDSKFSGGDLYTSLTHQLALVYRALIIAEEDEDPHLIDMCTFPQFSSRKDPMSVEFLPSCSQCMLLLEMT